MKLQFVGLAAVGVVAALSAAVLVARAQSATGGADEAEVEVLVASRGLSAITTLESSGVTTKRVAKSQAPKDALSDPVQVLGQVLAVPMVEGQPFTATCFAGDGSGVQLAANLKNGMRAVSVALADYAVLDGLLYPGSRVDVIASFDMRSKGSRTMGVISKTLLRGIEVLAVENKTANAPKEGEGGDSKNARKAGDRRHRVTLLVNDTQAQSLQLAMDHGVVTLALRNPTDTAEVTEQITKLTDLGIELEDPWEPETGEGSAVTAPAPVQVVEAAPPAVPAPEAAPKVRMWNTVVLKAGNATTMSFPIPKGGPDSDLR